MKIQHFDSEDRAVSPVIGVILMVAITVILAAVIGTFVMGIGQDASQSAPQSSLSMELESGNESVAITHDGGDALVDENTKVLLTNETSGTTLTFAAGSGTATWSVGDEVSIAVDPDPNAFLHGPWPQRSASGNFTGIQAGTQYTLKIIDTKSQRTIFETTSTA